jgi:hypothetical protein
MDDYVIAAKKIAGNEERLGCRNHDLRLEKETCHDQNSHRHTVDGEGYRYRLE